MFILLALHAACHLDAACSPAASGIVGWWPGDGDATDLTGTNNGVLQSGATASAVGVVGSAFSFDGNSSYVQIPDSPELRPTNLTIEAWVRFTSLDTAGNAQPGEEYIVFKQNTRTSGFEGYNLAKLRGTGGDVLAFIVSSSAGQVITLRSTSLVTTGLWYHVAGVRGSNFTQIYLNGQLEGQTNVNFPQDYGSYPLMLGTSGQAYWDRKFSGFLDEVALYNRALSSNEIAAIYTAGAAGKCKTAGAPEIITQPRSQSVVAGTTAVFTADAIGTAPLRYQWQFNGADIPDATSTNLTLNVVQPTNAGAYTVVVTNSSGSATSTVATLTVFVPPVITTQPESLTNIPGTIATFTGLATGSAPLTYRWRLNDVNLTDGGRLNGATTNALTITAVQATDSGSYTLVASNAVGAVTSVVASLTVVAPPAITLQPASRILALGNNVTFAVSASGDAPLSYQWQKDETDLADGGNVSGATAASLSLVSVQSNDAGDYRVVVTNSLGSVTSAVAHLTIAPPFEAVSQSAGAVVLVNSHSARYADFQHSIQPYLNNFGFPYTVLDISTNALGTSLSNCAVIIIGHGQLDTNLTYLDQAAQDNISLAVSNGTGLVNFDNDLSSAGVARYQFVQNIFGFGYGTGGSGTSVTLPATEPPSQMHFITARHPTNDTVALRSSLSVPGITVPGTTNVLARVGNQPLVAVAKYGDGRAVQWASYGWMSSTVLGPVDGLDDVLWRGVVWAARKPFVVRGMPNFVTMRVDDVDGPLDWVHAANAVGFKPFVAIMMSNVSAASAADLRGLVTNGNATAGIHSFTDTGFFYFNHQLETANPDIVQSNYFYLGTQWHASHGIPMAKICATHYSELGPNCFAGLKAWGIEYVPIEVVPGTVEYATPGAAWVVGGPYRLYETPQPGQVKRPTYYADWLSVPGHPEFDGQFFNIYSEVRDVSSCNEWCPDNDVGGSISRGTTILKRSLDSMVMATLFSHEWYIHPTLCCGSTTITSNNWRMILQGITNNLAAYQPVYVTLDHASQYVRATRTSRLESCAFDPGTGLLMAMFSGHTDMDTQVSVFVDADGGITNSVVIVPAFFSTETNTLATFASQPAPPEILSAAGNLITNAGTTVQLTVNAVGATPLTYQWVRDGAPLTDAGDVSGASTPVLTLTDVNGTNSGDYRVVITNSLGAATSGTATLTVVLPPQFTSASVSPGGAPRFSFTAVSNITYHIEISADLSNWEIWTNIADSNGTLQFTDSDATNAARRFYRAVWIP